MDKLLRYFLSSFFLITLLFISCEKEIETNEKLEESALLEIRKGYYQGSLYRQENSNQLIALNPGESSYYQGKSIAHSKIGDYHIAIPLLEKAYELDPKETGYYYGWLLLYLYRDYERSIKKLNEFDDFTPNQADFSWGEHVNFLKGLCYRQMGEYEKAIKEFSVAIDLEGEHVDVYAYVYRGICKMKQNKFESAKEDFDLGIQNYPQNSMAYFYKGLSYKKMNQFEKSREAYQESLNLLKQGYINRDAYREVFDAISIEMVQDYLDDLNEE